MANKTIWKFPLVITDTQEINVPSGAECLNVQMQSGSPQLWALVDPKETLGRKTIEMFGTGHNITSVMGGERQYIATIQVDALVFHVFEYTGI